MGAQWKQAGREINAHKKGQMVVKLVREIMVAAKLGGADPDLNARLFVAVEKAKKSSVTKDTIERAIKKGAGLTDEKVVYETVVYEGFAPHKVPVVVECLTDNRNRTAPEIRNCSRPVRWDSPAAWRFSSITSASSRPLTRTRTATRRPTRLKPARRRSSRSKPQKFPPDKKARAFLTEIKDLDHVSKALKAAGWNVIASEMRYVAKNFTEVSEAHRKEVMDFLHALDDHDDVHHVYAAMK
jgi:transcriptional/translational regulatory protein YebC/TACO1